MKTLTEIANNHTSGKLDYCIYGTDDTRGRTRDRYTVRVMRRRGARVVLDQRRDDNGAVIHALTTWEIFAQ